MGFAIDAKDAWAFAKKYPKRLLEENVAIAISDDESTVLCMTIDEEDDGVHLYVFVDEEVAYDSVAYSSLELEIEINEIVAEYGICNRSLDGEDIITQLELLGQSLGIEDITELSEFQEDFLDLLLRYDIDIL
ncbi:MAG: hypothetical protein MJZ03_00700 [archaeon]|nr:hypothetical protein [archaeon]